MLIDPSGYSAATGHSVGPPRRGGSGCAVAGAARKAVGGGRHASDQGHLRALPGGRSLRSPIPWPGIRGRARAGGVSQAPVAGRAALVDTSPGVGPAPAGVGATPKEVGMINRREYHSNCMRMSCKNGKKVDHLEYIESHVSSTIKKDHQRTPVALRLGAGLGKRRSIRGAGTGGPPPSVEPVTAGEQCAPPA